MPRVVTFQNTEKLKKIVKTNSAISEKELAQISGVSSNTLRIYLSRSEFSHIQRERRPIRYYGIKEQDILKLKYLISRYYYGDDNG